MSEVECPLIVRANLQSRQHKPGGRIVMMQPIFTKHEGREYRSLAASARSVERGGGDRLAHLSTDIAV
jgi:hypothetical protein